MTDLDKSSLLSAIPPPEAVRERLAQLIREENLLRALLRLSIRKQRELDPNVPRAREVRCGP